MKLFAALYNQQPPTTDRHRHHNHEFSLFLFPSEFYQLNVPYVFIHLHYSKRLVHFGKQTPFRGQVSKLQTQFTIFEINSIRAKERKPEGFLHSK